MTSSLDMIRGRSNVVTLTNNSGGALVAGDVCIQDTSADEKATTTTSAASVLKVFVAAESIANGATGKFYESGYCPLVNVNASVTRGRFLFTHTVAKQAAENATYGAGAFGKILKSGTTPSAIIYSATAQSAGGSIGGSSGSTDNAIIRADGTGGSTVQSSLATVDDSGTMNIPTGQTYNINGSAHTHAGAGENHILVRDKKAQNTQPGQGTNNTWVKRAINEEVYDTGNNCSIASDQITLAAGTYRCWISCPAFGVNRHQARLQDVTNAVTLALGTSEVNATTETTNKSIIIGRFVLTGSTVCEVQHNIQTSAGTTHDFGVEANFTDEIYTVAEFWKE